MTRLVICLSVTLLLTFCCQAQDSSGVSFTYSQQRVSADSVLLSIKANIKHGYQLYALQKNDSDPLYSSIQFNGADTTILKTQIAESGNAQRAFDSSIRDTATYFADTVLWQTKIALKSSDSATLKGTITYLLKSKDEYIPGEESFRFSIPKNTEVALSNDTQTKPLWWIFITAFLGGLLALLTPCVYSMIPVTVSFFTKRSKTKKEGIRNALYYALSIIIIFTLFGFAITLIFGPAALNNLATNWVANLFFFLLFLVFGISFLGAFDITLPSSWSTRSDNKAGATNFAGIFFMALTLVIVSFSCTGPIIGNLLVLAAKGSYYGPLTGMFGFSLALSLPFAFFAFFPGKLNVLGKAGGWLNAVKVSLGFLELALALKFLSNADLERGWRLLDREVFISLWIVIFALLGLYLLGKLKLHHDGDLPLNDFGVPYISITRLFLSILILSFALSMLPGLWGAPLKAISAFVPPMGTQDFTLSTVNNNPSSSAGEHSQNEAFPHPVKYYEKMKVYEPEVMVKYGMTTYFDYDEALAAARKLHKPLMLDFTGINCVNCRKMEGQVWSAPEVMNVLKNDFVIASLYVDVQNIELPSGEQYFSKELNKQVETLGDKNADMQVKRFDANSQPFYFFLDNNEHKLAENGYGYDPDIQKFLEHLNKVKQAFK